ncbi:MAG: hypothetical protein IJ093_01800 [Bacilli bacterium]|nr:hypothetical protein [Bacilli bacterium]
MEEEGKKTKSKKKIIIISLIIVLLLCALGIGGYFLYQYKKLKEPIKSNWGQTYYMYLKDVNENGKQEKASLPKDPKDAKLTFYEVEDVKDPIMVITYTQAKEDYSNVYYIHNNKVNILNYVEPATVELLYNIENKEYNYYSHVKANNENKYKSIAEQIKERIAELEKGKANTTEEEVTEETEYVFTEESVDKVTDIDGKEISITKFDQTFIKPNVKETYIKYDTDLEEKELKEAITNEVDNYQAKDQIVTEKVTKQVEEKVTEVEKTKQEMADAKAAVEKKEAEEKAKREAEEREKALKEGLKVGSQTLKYGTYTTSVPGGGMNGNDLYGTITLKPNGEFHIKTNFEQSSGESKTIDEDGTYTTGKSMNSYDSQDTIFFKTNSGYKFSYFVTNSSYFNSQWIIYKYSGN